MLSLVVEHVRVVLKDLRVSHVHSILVVLPDLCHHLSNKASHQAVLTILDLILDMPCQRLDSKLRYHLRVAFNGQWLDCMRGLMDSLST